mgnify:CR=1 FL=1
METSYALDFTIRENQNPRKSSGLASALLSAASLLASQHVIPSAAKNLKLESEILHFVQDDTVLSDPEHLQAGFT